MKKPTSTIRCVAQFVDFLDYKKAQNKDYKFDLNDIRFEEKEFIQMLARQVLKNRLQSNETIVQILAALHNQTFLILNKKWATFKKENTEKMLINLYKLSKCGDFQFQTAEPIDIRKIANVEESTGFIRVRDLLNFLDVTLTCAFNLAQGSL